MKILIINGANLDMTGIREKELYGEKCLDSIEKDLNYGKDYMLKVFRFDEKHKNVQFGI